MVQHDDDRVGVFEIAATYREDRSGRFRCDEPVHTYRAVLAQGACVHHGMLRGHMAHVGHQVAYPCQVPRPADDQPRAGPQFTHFESVSPHVALPHHRNDASIGHRNVRATSDVVDRSRSARRALLRDVDKAQVVGQDVHAVSRVRGQVLQQTGSVP